jgi:hypothetical protein
MLTLKTTTAAYVEAFDVRCHQSIRASTGADHGHGLFVVVASSGRLRKGHQMPTAY